VELTVRVAVPDARAMLEGWMDAVRFVDGNTARSTAVLNLRSGATVMVETPFVPEGTLIGLGLADRLKSGPTTVIEIMIWCIRSPDTPIIATV